MERAAQQRLIRRLVKLAVAMVAIEAALWLIIYLSPALAAVMHTLMLIAALLFIALGWRSTRTRHGDRRHADRRSGGGA